MSKGCDPSLPSCPQERLESLTKGATGAQAGGAKGVNPDCFDDPRSGSSWSLGSRRQEEEETNTRPCARDQKRQKRERETERAWGLRKMVGDTARARCLEVSSLLAQQLVTRSR